jgi:precorrin-2 dehydrogenase / sirohydrochlorin ferrochelatase
MTQTSLFPMFVKLRGRQVLVVGAGVIGESKIDGLLDTGANVRVVALNATPRVKDWARIGQISLELRRFDPDDLDGAFLAVVATSSPELNRQVFEAAQARGILCNVVDVPDQCDFFYPAVVKRGDLQIAISTSGQSPSLAKKLREQLERQFGPAYTEWVRELGDTRRLVLSSDLDPSQKRELLSSLASREALEALLEHELQPAMRGEMA